METDDLLVLFISLAIPFSIVLAEPLQEIKRSIQEFPSKLFSFLINPIFIISISIIFLVGLIFLTISSYKSSIEYREELTKEEEIVKKPTKSRAKKTHPKLTEIYLEPSKEDGDEVEVEFEDEDSGEENDSEEEPYEPMPMGIYRKSVNIRVDDNKRYFHKKNISKDEVKYLLNKDYQIKKYKNLLNGRMENFLLLPRFNESFTHLFLVHNISEFLEKNGIEIELFITKKPDIVFQINGKRFAIEVETGSIFSKIDRMKEKLKVLENYDSWFFVVTNKNKVKEYAKYGKPLDFRYLKTTLPPLLR